MKKITIGPPPIGPTIIEVVRTEPAYITQIAENMAAEARARGIALRYWYPVSDNHLLEVWASRYDRPGEAAARTQFALNGYKILHGGA